MVLTCLSITVDGAIVIPWTVCCVDPGTSFSQLFEKLQAGSIELLQPYAAKLQHCEISQGNVSKSKDTPFSIVDKQLPVDEVCCQFGSYVKLQTVDTTLTRDDTTKAIKDKPDLQAFFNHCCQVRHYSFLIKKCGEDDCSICKPLRMPRRNSSLPVTYLTP